MTLRDIRTDLRQRVDEIREQRKRLAAQDRELEAQEASYAKVLAAEERRQTEASEETVKQILDYVDEMEKPGTATPPTDFVLEALRNAENLTLHELKNIAAKQRLVIPRGASMGRTLHGALLSLSQLGRVQRVGDREWKLAKRVAGDNGVPR